MTGRLKRIRKKIAEERSQSTKSPLLKLGGKWWDRDRMLTQEGKGLREKIFNREACICF
jgi:hypothetical protein